MNKLDQLGGYGVIRTVSEAHEMAEKARADGLRGCFPSAAVVLSDELKKAEGFDYEAETQVTNSNSWHGEKVNFELFTTALAIAIRSLKMLDGIKKTLFYGRELPEALHTELAIPGQTPSELTCALLPYLANLGPTPQIAQDRIHGIVGTATEAGEQLELLSNTLYGEDFDCVNAAEESGDTFWYQAIFAASIGLNFDQIQRKNIEKLRLRFPNKFTEFDANNRNLTKERELLEKVVDKL